MKKLLWGLCVVLVSCGNPFEDFVLGLKEPIEEATVRIQFNLPENGKLPQNLEFSVEGPDAGKVVTNLNSRNFKISREGVIILAVSPEFTPTPAAPVEFTVVARAEGYLKIIKTFRFTGKANQSFQAQLVKEDLSGSLTTFQAEIKNTTYQTPDPTQKLLLTVQGNTIFRDRAGAEIPGAKELVMMRYDHKTAKNNLPAGGVAANPVGQDGKPLENAFDFLQVASLAFVQISSREDSRVVKTLDTPLQLTMELNPEMINPLTGARVKTGDMLTITSYDTDTGVWKDEGETRVVSGAGGKLQVSFPVPHLSFWMAGWRRTLCKNGPSFIVNSTYSGVDISFLAQLTDAASGKVIREYYMAVNNGSQLTISNIPAESEKVKLVLYDYSNYHGGNRTAPVAVSQAVSLCGTSTVNLPAFKVTLPRLVEIEMYTNCPAGQTLDKATLPAQMRIQYSEVGKGAWRDAGIVRREQHIAGTYRLKFGARYDIRASSDGGVTWPYQQKDQLINKTRWLIDVKTFGGKCK